MGTNPKIGTYEYYERLYDVEASHWWSRGMRAIAAGILDEHCAGRPGLKILDAGCGTGINLAWLERYSAPALPVGSDIAAVALDFCRRRGHTSLARASVLELPFEDESFDLVICNDVIQHLPGPGSDITALREFVRVLRPGGHVFVRTNSNQGFGRDAAAGSDDYRRYDLDATRRAVGLAGLALVRATHANFLMSLPPALKRIASARHARNGDGHAHGDHGLGIRLMPKWLSPLNSALYRLLCAEAWVVSRSRASLPFGHTIFFLAEKRETSPSRGNLSDASDGPG